MPRLSIFVVALSLALLPASAQTFRRASIDRFVAPGLAIATAEGVHFSGGFIAFGPGASLRAPIPAEPDDSNSWRRLIYHEVWPSIDVEFYFRDQHLEYDVVARRDADLGLVSLAFPKAERLVILPSGELSIKGDAGQAVFSQPVSFSNGRAVASRYVLRGPALAGFEAEWNGRETLRIDPALVFASANLVSTQDRQGWVWAPDYTTPTYLTPSTGAVLIPGSGGILFAGQETGAANVSWPVLFGNVTNAYTPVSFVGLRTQSTSVGAIIAVSSNITGLAEDPAGGFFVAGTTNAPLPVTPGLFRTQMAGLSDGFLMHMPRDLSKVDWITYLDGGTPTAMVADSTGNIYLTGQANSGKPYVAGSYLTANPGGRDLFVLKLSHDGKTGIFSAIVGGTSDEYGVALTVASDGSVLIGGTTNSTNLGIPPNALQNSISTASPYNYTHGFVLRLSPDGSRILGGTYAGGSNYDEVRSVAVMSNGDVLLSGITSSPDFPATQQVFGDITQAPGYNASGFIDRLNSQLTAAVFSETLAGAALIDAHVSSDAPFLFAVSPNTVPKTQDAYLGPAAHINLSGPTLLEFDPANGRPIYSGGLGRTNYGSQSAPMLATGNNGLVALAALSSDDSAPISSGGQGVQYYAAPFLQEFQFGDASPAASSISVYGLSQSSSPVTGTVDFATPRKAVTLTPVEASGQNVLSIRADQIAPPGSLAWTASPAPMQHGLTAAVVNYMPSGGTVQQGFTQFLVFTDKLAATPASVQASGSAGGAGVPVTIRVSALAGLPFAVSADQTWIQPSLPGAVSPAEISFTLQAAKLAAGTWSGNIQLMANGFHSDTLTIPVQLTLK